MNRLGSEGRPFLFFVDFLQRCPVVIPLNEIDDRQIRFQTPLCSASRALSQNKINLQVFPIDKEEYASKFGRVVHEIKRGNSFVVNLTCQTPITCDASTLDIYHASNARYKLWYKNHFVCFSPETFVRIENGTIVTCPMKGTIDASLPNATEQVLNNEKEKAEHNCVVDLLRNDISRIADRVEMTRYRYVETIETGKGALLQVSSEIRGRLNPDYQSQLGDILFSMLPAGSITGAPKIRTTEIIREVEKYDRGYYSGVFGVFDGQVLDSAVMIRFIEETDRGLMFKSGGGITARSNMDEEYNEMIAKIYVPVG
ncbi:MAG: aminodeoxychorismate synthase component [Bacteroidetes bacterium]|nr:aminodeoxychorismate synthase component [Bacteroidota bacterium]